MNTNTPRQLKMLGMLLFLLGLVTGFAIMAVKNPRMGLAAHMEGVMNGTFLVVAGLVWNELKMSNSLKKATLLTLVYGTFANWMTTLLAAILGTSEMTPLSGAGYTGSAFHETLVSGLLVSIGLTMVFAVAAMAYGLRGRLQ